MAQRPVDLPVVFPKGAGIFLAAPITQFQNNFGEIFSATRNTCKSNEILRGGKSDNGNVTFTNPEVNLKNALSQLKRRLTAAFPQDSQYISDNIDRLKGLVAQLYSVFPNVMSIVNMVAPDKNKILTMNFVGYRDDDQVLANKDKSQQLIHQFLIGTGKSARYFSRKLEVLIDNGGNPRPGRVLSSQENEIAQGLLKFFSENNFPHAFDLDGNETREVIFDGNYLNGDTQLNKFRPTHYIQSLFAAVMLLYINEPKQNRGIIFDNIERILRDLRHKIVWSKAKQQDAVDFLLAEVRLS